MPSWFNEASALAFVLLWAVAADLLIVALIFWYGRRIMELSERLKRLQHLVVEEQKAQAQQRQELRELGAGLNALVGILELLLAPPQVEDTRKGENPASPEPRREPLEPQGPLAKRLARRGGV